MNKNFKWLTAAISFICLLPLLLVHQEMWDGVIYEMGYMKHDLSYLDPILWTGKVVTFQIWSFLYELSLLTGLPHKFFTNVLTAISIFGLAWETGKYLRRQYAVSDLAAKIAVWFVLAFPVWHVFMSAANSDYIFYLWLFVLAVNMRHRNMPIAILLFVVSCQLYSVFAMAVGFACAEFIMEADGQNYRRRALQVVVFSAVLLAGFVALRMVIDVNGPNGEINTFKLDRLRSFINFGILVVSVLSLWSVMHWKTVKRDESYRLLRLLLSFLALSFFAGLAFWAIGRPMRFFAFGSYTAHYTIMCAIPFALLIAILIDFGFNKVSHRIVYAGVGFLLTASIVLAYQGYDHKIAALVFKDMMVNSFKQIPPPESGYVSIEAVGYEAPRHFHTIDSNMAMYKAYGKSAWLLNGFWAKRGHVYDEVSLVEEYGPLQKLDKRGCLAEDLAGTSFTRYRFILDNFHQEGRLWYWYNYLVDDYSYFKPRIVKS